MKYKPLITKVPTAIIYARVSSKEQLEGYSLESQEKVCRAFAEKNHLEVLKVFVERGESAKTADRTKLREMMKFCEKKKNKIGKLIIYKIDRLARNNEDYYALKVVFRKYGVAIQSATEPIDNDPSGKLMEGVLSALAEFDNNVRAQRTAEGMRTRMKNGYWGWGAPVGYKNVKNGSGEKVIIPDPQRAPVVKKIFEEYAKGFSTIRGIAQKATALNMRSKHGKKISPQLVMRILVNPIYCGRIEVPKWGISVQGKHEPIVSVALFVKVQKVMGGDSPWKVAKNKTNPDFPLRGIRCSSCGGNISGGWTSGRNKKYAYYGCIREDCPKRASIRKEDFENDFTAFLSHLTPSPPDLEVVKESVKLAYRSEMNDIVRDNERIGFDIEKLRQQKQNLFSMKMKELISDDEFRKENDRLNNNITQLELSKRDLVDEGLDVASAVDYAFEFIAKLPTEWKDMPVEDLRVLRAILFPENLSYEYPGIKTAQIPIIYTVNQADDAEKTRLVPPTGFEPVFSP